MKCKIHISHQKMLQKSDKSGIKQCLSFYFSLPAKFQLIQSGIFAPIRAQRGGSTTLTPARAKGQGRKQYRLKNVAIKYEL